MINFNIIFSTVIASLLVMSSSIAQYSIGGGYAHYGSLNGNATWNGINLYYETPRTDFNTFFLRGTLMLPHRGIDSTWVEAIPGTGTSPAVLPVEIQRSLSFFSIDGGNRTYFKNSYDAGVAPYVMSQFRGIISSYRERFSEFDPTKYQAPLDVGKQYSVFIGMGVNVGVKLQLPYRGAVTIDLGADYLIPLMDDAQMLYYRDITQIGFFLNLSYRFDSFIREEFR
jgi:hypothetical protein